MTKNEFHTIKKKLKLTDKGVADALNANLFMVQQWSSGIWDIPRPMAKFLRTLLNIKRDYDTQYQEGYHGGYEEGRHEGYMDGYSAGYKDRYEGRFRIGT